MDLRITTCRIFSRPPTLTKLIPKKDDTSNIRNWRPISLLSNFYKLISRAINNRLKAIAPRILSRAQKGFVPGKYMHEVLINTIERLEYCKDKKLNGFVVSADLKKAFDSVSHDFMKKCYDFYNFGPVIKKWLESIGTGRNASIILGAGEFTEPFDLGKDHAQGDSPSPLLFNFAQQVALFRIELDPGISWLRSIPLLPQIRAGEKFAEAESNYETDKCDGFADDNYTFTGDDIESLRNIALILTDFEKLTGLGCNIKKTAVMTIGNPDLLPIPFTYTNELKILGFTVKQNEPVNVTNYNIVKIKVKRIINNWRRFGLTLLGRIMVVKSLVLPHVSFVGSILEPPADWVNSVTKIIEKFVLGPERISKAKLYASTKKGGLGLICIEKYILSQQCAWLKKCAAGINDNWKYDLYTKTEGLKKFVTMPLKSGPVDTIINPISKCTLAHSLVGNNFLRVPIVNNEIFTFGRAQHNLTEEFLSTNLGLSGQTLYKICWDDLVTDEKNLLDIGFLGRKISFNVTM
jgi:hypothetical protein